MIQIGEPAGYYSKPRRKPKESEYISWKYNKYELYTVYYLYVLNESNTYEETIKSGVWKEQ